jgi:hypothetical protein
MRAVSLWSAHSSGDVALSDGLARVLEDLLGFAVLNQMAVVEEHRGVRDPSGLAQIVGHDDQRERRRHLPLSPYGLGVHRVERRGRLARVDAEVTVDGLQLIAC